MSSEDGMVGGVLVNRYQLVAHLRPGRFGDFWRGIRVSDQSPVAIKILKPELFGNATALARFERETQLLGSLGHDNLLAVEEYGRTSTGAPFIVTAPHDGRLLSDAIAELTLTIDDVCRIGSEVAALCAHAHDMGVIHRGLDPEAVLLVEDAAGVEHAKVQDFGLAHIARTIAFDGPVPALTKIGERLGRYEYMAPEYIEAQRLDSRTDLYVLGIIVFEMLTGQPPFVGPPMSVFKKHLYETPWTPSELAEQDVPPWLDALVLSLLEKEADHRPASAHVVANALRNRAFLAERPLPSRHRGPVLGDGELP